MAWCAGNCSHSTHWCQCFRASVTFSVGGAGSPAPLWVTKEVIPVWAKLAVGLVSVTAAVLSSLQTFFNHSDRAEKHRASAARFGAVRRKLEIVFAKRSEGMEQKQVESLRQELDTLAEESLYVPAGVFLRVQESILYTGEENANKAN